jgi:hypothetical protein
MMFINLLYILILFKFISADSVCDEELLKLELRQDLEDNGILDCLRLVIYITQSY